MLRKIDNGTFMMKAILAVCGGALVLCLFIPDPKLKWDFLELLVVMCLGMILVLVPSMYYSSLRQQWEEGNRVIVDIQMTFLSKEIVDQRLTQLADEFTALCERQVKFQNAESAVAETLAIGNDIARAKVEFWSAHALAKELGYETMENVGDYTTKPKIKFGRRVHS